MKMKKSSIAIALFCAICLSGCGINLKNSQHNDSTSQNTNTSSETNSENASGAENSSVDSEIYKIGDTVNIDEWEITVNSVEVTDKISNKVYGTVETYFSPKEGNKYVVFNISIKNLATDSNTFLPAASLNDPVKVGLEYQEYSFSSSNLLGHSDDLHTTSLNPLSSKTGILAFDIAEEVVDNLDEITLVFSTKKESRVFATKSEKKTEEQEAEGNESEA